MPQDLPVVKPGLSYTGKRVLVTGADGFIGSHLTEALLAAGAEVRATCWYHPRQDRGWLDAIPAQPALEVVIGDIRDANTCRRWVESMDVVFHLAALIGIPYSYEAPESYLQTNLHGTFHLLEACRANLTPFVFMSSSEVYGTALQAPIDEQHPLQPQSPYSASKIGAEALVRSYWHSYGLPVLVARAFNTYGPRQSPRAIIPAVISQLAAGATELALGDLRPTRDLVYVADTCQALLHLGLSQLTDGAIVNICTGKDHRMSVVVELLQQIMGTAVPVVTDPQRLRPVHSEVMQLLGNPGLLLQRTRYLPSTSLQAGLAKTIAWFQTHPSSYSPFQYHV